MDKKTTASASSRTKKAVRTGESKEGRTKADVARLWTEGLSSPDEAHTVAVGAVLRDDVERVDARGVVTGRTQVLAEFGQSVLAPNFATGTWSEPEVDGDVVTSTCIFQPGAPLPGVTVKVTVTSGKISRVDTGPSDADADEGTLMLEQEALDAATTRQDLLRVHASQTGDEPYELGTDSLPQPETPRGSVTEYRLDDSQRFPGTKRRYWVYVPAQYTPDHPANLMVFQDGATYLQDVNAHVVFDNLIHRGEMPICVGVFVEPGDRGPGIPIWGGDTNRNVEYDTLSDAYAQFLLDELLPRLPVAVTDDATRRAICGHSSGGICAFTAAWERPEAFGNVVSHCGSFVNIFGGHEYPSLIRRTERKPLRVFLQTGERDVDIVFGNWPIANRDMAAALAYRGYEYELVIGEGGHTLKHGASIFPDTMRWLWGRTDDRRAP